MNTETGTTELQVGILNRILTALLATLSPNRKTPTILADDLDENAKLDIGLMDGRLTRQRMRDQNHGPTLPLNLRNY